MSVAQPKTIPWYKSLGINGEKFSSQKAVFERVRPIINSTPIDGAIPAEHFAFFCALLANHTEWEEKQGCGVQDILVRMNVGDHYANRGLWLVRLDGSEIDISWLVAVSAKPLSPMRLLQDAARHAVAPQIERARAEGFRKGVCTICGGPLSNTLHIDHKPPFTFDLILNTWLTARSPDGTLEGGIATVQIDDAGAHSVFGLSDQRDDWLVHHDLWADLRATHPKCNMAQGKGA